MKRLGFTIFCLFILFSWQKVPARYPAGESKNSCERRILVGLNNYEPFAYRENGRLKGLAHDIVQALKDKVGCEYFETELSARSEAEHINNDRIDMLVLMVKTTEYEKGGVFIPFYETYRQLTVTKKAFSKNRKIKDYINDDKIKFAYMIGNRTVLSKEEEDRLLKSSRLIGTPDPEGAFRLLKEGRVQAVLFSALLASHYVDKMKMTDQTEKVRDETQKIPVGIYLSKRRVSPAEEEMFVRAFEEIKKDGSFVRILSKYMSLDQALYRLNN